MGAAFRPPPPLPREHGAWVMVCMPLVLGAAQAEWGLSASWLIPSAVLLIFLAHYAVVQSDRRAGWAAAYCTLAGVLFAATVALTSEQNRTSLLAIAALSALCGGSYTAACYAGAGRFIITELVSMVGMSLSAPMMVLAAGRPLERGIAGGAVMAFGYSLSILSFVRAYTGRKQGRTASAALCIVVHALMLGGLAMMGKAGWLPPWWLTAFLPVIWRTAWGLARPPKNLRAVGMRELWVSLAFAILAATVLSMP
jgi:hypothetical protein